MVKERDPLDRFDAKPRSRIMDVAGGKGAESRELTLQDAMRPAMDAMAFKSLRLYTGVLDLDLKCGLSFGTFLQILGRPHDGKSLLTLLILAAVQRTCRYCFTPYIEWIDDYSTLLRDRKEWDRLTQEWTATGQCPFPSRTSCRCESDPKISSGRGVLIDAEKSFDPYWAATWGVDVGDPSRYDAVIYKDAAKYGSIWTGVRHSDDENLVIMRPTSLQQTRDLLLPTLQQSAAEVIIYDSVALVAVDEELKSAVEDPDAKTRVGPRARALTSLAPLLLSSSVTANQSSGARPLIILVNQFTQGPTKNFKADPNIPVGGLRLQQMVEQTLRITRSSTNEGLSSGWKERTVMRDISFKMTKSKAAGSGSDGASGDARLYCEDYQLNDKVTFRAGTTDDAQRLLEHLRELDPPDPEIFREEKGKAYWVFSRPFKRVADIVTFLGRRDVGYMLRFILFAKHLQVSARMHLREHDYGYCPYPDEPILKVMHRYEPQTGDSLRELRQKGGPVGDGPLAARNRTKSVGEAVKKQTKADRKDE